MFHMFIPRPKEVWLDDVRKKLRRVFVAPQFFTEEEKLQCLVVFCEEFYGDLEQAQPKVEHLNELMKVTLGG